eukprot:1414086-Rhodomonas_salina.1
MVMMRLVRWIFSGGRAAVPNYRNEFAVMSREKYLLFDAVPIAKHVQVYHAAQQKKRRCFPPFDVGVRCRFCSYCDLSVAHTVILVLLIL